MNSKLKNDSTDYLFKAILSLENEEDCYRFFEDLCTSAELKAMSQRLVVAKMLTEKKVYTETRPHPRNYQPSEKSVVRQRYIRLHACA